jgi:predicted dehydrogenase
MATAGALSKRLRGVAIGAGYFSQFHYDAWQRHPDVELVALCNRDRTRGQQMATRFGVPTVYTNPAEMLDRERPDFVDIITPPETHGPLCALAGERGIHIICQKALAPTFGEAHAIVAQAAADGVRFMVHDNFRFQPWHRELRRLLQTGTVGRPHAIAVRTRMGDGWGADAYLSRQPYFRTMPQLLVFETGVHFIDVFRSLVGEVREVFARLRRLNAAIAGEDSGILYFEFESGAVGLWDANRYNESLSADARYTFGEFLIEGDAGMVRLDEEGGIAVKKLGDAPTPHPYVHDRRGFAGDCVYATVAHFVDRLRDGSPFETDGPQYLRTLAVQEAAYRSAASGQPVTIPAAISIA